MEYTIWLQILMELALSVSGEQDLNLLLKNTNRALHRKLDCTHVVIYKNEDAGLSQIAISPHWAQNDDAFLDISRKLSKQCEFEQRDYIMIEDQNHFYYAFLLKGYGMLCFARGKAISLKLIKELPQIMDMLATNILACESFKRQIQVEKELRKKKNYIEYLAYHDTLTTLPNRRRYLEILSECLDEGISGAVVLLDLDNFKRINDTLGHIFGDEVLKYISRSLMKYNSETVSIFRVGGDEFLLLIKEKTRDEIEMIIRKIFSDFKKVSVIGENKVNLAFSVGITLFPEDASDISQLFMNADLALYSVKNKNKNAYRFFDSELSKEMLRKLTITNYLREAINTDGFKLVYQPQVDSKTGKVVAYEALLRFKHHSTSPTEFIPIAEENQMIIEIGRIVTKKAIKQLREWMDQGCNVKKIAINFSPAQIYDMNYFEFLKEELELSHVDPKMIEIEITETIFIKNKKSTLDFLRKLKDLGVGLSLDDYGTGYCSLYYLTSLPLDKIKIDRSVNQKFLEENLEKVICCLIHLAHGLGFKVVAEGIENEKQFQMLNNVKCDIIQGFLFSKPLEKDEIPKTFEMNYFDNLSDDFLLNSITTNINDYVQEDDIEREGNQNKREIN